MNDVQSEPAEMKMVALVRNADGQPQFDDWENINPIFYPILTEEDWVYIHNQRTATCQ